MPGQGSNASHVNELLAQMSLEEKVAQIGSARANELLTDGELDPEKADEYLGHGIGHVTRIGGEGSLSL